MKLDRYSKLILTVITLMLTVIACKSVIQPGAAAAEGPLAGVQFARNMVGFFAIDSKTGDVWGYFGQPDQKGLPNVEYEGRFTELGKPLARK